MPVPSLIKTEDGKPADPLSVNAGIVKTVGPLFFWQFSWFNLKCQRKIATCLCCKIWCTQDTQEHQKITKRVSVMVSTRSPNLNLLDFGRTGLWYIFNAQYCIVVSTMQQILDDTWTVLQVVSHNWQLRHKFCSDWRNELLNMKSPWKKLWGDWWKFKMHLSNFWCNDKEKASLCKYFGR